MALKDKNAPKLFYTDMTSVLQGCKDGNDVFGNSYDMLLKVMADSDSEAWIVVRCLRDLEQCLTLLNEEYATLLKIILHMNWLDRGLELISVYQAFMLNLVSAHMNYLKPCLKMLVKKFSQEYKTDAANPAIAKIKTEENAVHLHNLLKSLSQLVPMTSVLLVPVLEESFPYINKAPDIFDSYCRNALSVCHYLPALRLKIVELVTKNILKLDVRASRNDINSVIADGEDDDNSDEEERMFDMEDEDLKPSLKLETDIKDEAGEDCGSDVKDIDLKEKKEPTVMMEDKLASELPVASSLDSVMTLMFKFLHEVCHVKGELDWNLAKTVYRELLSVFDKYIFLTHSSSHVQFLIFYICSFREPLADGFIDYLWKKVVDPSSQSVHRQTAACYMGSLLTRAAFISPSTAQEVVALLVKWIHQYLDQSSDLLQAPDLSHHAAFYSVCQTVFYIFCFRSNEFLQLESGHKWCESLNFQRIITSKLNPLRVCVPIVVKTFASIARIHQLAFCDTIIERNNRYSLPIASSTYSLASTEELKLDAYFPFDPYLLPRSRHVIIPLYKQFAGSLPDAGDETEDENDDDDDDDDFVADEDSLTKSAPMAMSLGKSPVDFLHYGTSPGFKYG